MFVESEPLDQINNPKTWSKGFYMDIKEIAQNQVKTVDGTVYENKPVTKESNRYVVPEDSECISDIKFVKDKVDEYIADSFEALKKESGVGMISNENKIKAQAQIIDNCKEALKFLEMYKNIRLNVELASKIKFNVDPLPDKN